MIVEVRQRGDVLGPIEILQRKCPAIAANPGPQLWICGKPLERIGDFGALATLQQQGLFTIVEEESDIGARKDHRPAGSEKLGQLRGEAIVIDFARLPRLNQRVRSRQEPGTSLRARNPRSITC